MFGVKSKAQKEAEYKVLSLKLAIQTHTTRLETRLKAIGAAKDYYSPREYAAVSKAALSYLLFEVELLKEWGREE